MTTVVKFVQMWIFTLVQCSFISLSVTRMVLIFKVGTFFLIFKAMDEKVSLFQPTEFNQLEHEKRFKLVFKGLMIVITLCVGLFFVLLHFLEPGSLSKWGAMQTSGVVAAGEDNGIKTMFPLLIVDVFWGLTALVMAISDVFARVMMPAPTVIHPLDCSVGFFTNNIPFLTLNFSIVIGIFVNMVMIHLFNAFGAHGVQISAILTVFLVTNKKARKHVKLRLQQKFDSFTVGGANSVHPSGGTNLVHPSRGTRSVHGGTNLVHGGTSSVHGGTNLVHPSGSTYSVPLPGSNNPLHPVVSVALVPLRDQLWEFSFP